MVIGHKIIALVLFWVARPSTAFSGIPRARCRAAGFMCALGAKQDRRDVARGTWGSPALRLCGLIRVARLTDRVPR